MVQPSDEVQPPVEVQPLGTVEFEPVAQAQKKRRRLVKKYAQTEAPNQPETAEVQPHTLEQKEKGRRVDAQTILGEVG